MLPHMLVVNTSSPTEAAAAPKPSPSQTVPSSRIRYAFDMEILPSWENGGSRRHSVAAITALMVCMRFSASSNTMERGPSNT